MTTSHGPGRVPGVRRPTDANTAQDGRDGAHVSDGDCCAHVGPLLQQLEQGGAEWTRMAEQHYGLTGELDAALIRLADMTRQRDEAVKAFQRERARVGRVEALADKWRNDEMPDPTTADVDLRVALADRPTDA